MPSSSLPILPLSTVGQNLVRSRRPRSECLERERLRGGQTAATMRTNLRLSGQKPWGDGTQTVANNTDAGALAPQLPSGPASVSLSGR